MESANPMSPRQALKQAQENALQYTIEELEAQLPALEKKKEQAIETRQWDTANRYREQIIGYTQILMQKKIEQNQELSDYLKQKYLSQIPDTDIKDEYIYTDRILLLTYMKQFHLRLKSEIPNFD